MDSGRCEFCRWVNGTVQEKAEHILIHTHSGHPVPVSTEWQRTPRTVIRLNRYLIWVGPCMSTQEVSEVKKDSLLTNYIFWNASLLPVWVLSRSRGKQLLQCFRSRRQVANARKSIYSIQHIIHLGMENASIVLTDGATDEAAQLWHSEWQYKLIKTLHFALLISSGWIHYIFDP